MRFLEYSSGICTLLNIRIPLTNKKIFLLFFLFPILFFCLSFEMRFTTEEDGNIFACFLFMVAL